MRVLEVDSGRGVKPVALQQATQLFGRVGQVRLLAAHDEEHDGAADSGHDGGSGGEQEVPPSGRKARE